MIIVTGTKRSGTSMWMQLMKAAGFPPIGDAFPRNWEKTLKDANPAGFYESELRKGIYYATNPHPRTGAYLPPDQTRNYSVKVFIPGLVRTDRAFIDKVVATMRPWRQYAGSLARLHQLEREAKKKNRDGKTTIPPPAYMPAALEWWTENFSLVSDFVTRGYPLYMVAYDSVLEEPEATLRRVFGWMANGDVDAAIAQVNQSLRTQDVKSETEDWGIEPSIGAVFDELYELVRNEQKLTQPFVDKLNETHERLEPQIVDAAKATEASNRHRKRMLAKLRKRKERGSGTTP